MTTDTVSVDRTYLRKVIDQLYARNAFDAGSPLHDIVIALETALQQPSAQINQCDGCMSGLALDNGMHRDASGKPIMVCQRSRYEQPAAPDLPPVGWQSVITKIRRGMEGEMPSAYDSEGYKHYANMILDGVCDELDYLESSYRDLQKQVEPEQPTIRDQILSHVPPLSEWPEGAGWFAFRPQGHGRFFKSKPKLFVDGYGPVNLESAADSMARLPEALCHKWEFTLWSRDDVAKARGE